MPKTGKPKIPANNKLLPNFIELETSTLCNRRCNWCPNSIYQRSRRQKNINIKLFNKIINELSALTFKGQISLHNYNEPLLDNKLFYYINKIRKKIPEAHIIIFTNGDYLDQAVLKKLADSGVKTLFISVHDAIANKNYKKIINRLNRKLNLKKELANISDRLGMKFSTRFKSMRVVYYISYPTMLTSRGGIIKEYSKKTRTNKFCYLPFSSCAIDFEGNFKICCEVYPASKVHKKNGIIGNSQKNKFLELWLSDSFNSFRKDILRGINKNILCSYCPGYNFNIDGRKMEEWKKFLNIK